ncbi:MAG: Oxidoreductase molybdopterin binding domain protein [Firmicutes bacterium ADurb.Bin182]|nr:MAG: Oxidoreductase molybdopterin binding domain protein [Firmicutes bacterium ADurb.Bin182]
MKKHPTILLSMLIALAVFTGCAQQTIQPTVPPSTVTPQPGLAADAKLEITGKGIDITLTAADMQSLPQETINCQNIDSNGDAKDVTVSGFSLGALLEQNGNSLARAASLNLIASDGYVMSVPSEEYADSDVYILLNFEGDALQYPRSCIPDKRAMYWVKELIKIEIAAEESSNEAAAEQVNRIDIFREGVMGMQAEKLNNRGFEVPAYSLKDYFEKYFGALPSDPILMIARDGFEKTETAGVFFENYVTLEAEEGEEDDLPLYFSETISDGMRVKQLELLISGSNAVYLGSEIAVPDLFEAVGMAEADSYSFIASDGFETVVPKDAIGFGKIFADETEGFIRAGFDGYDWGDTKGGGKIKYLVTIKANGGVSEASNKSEESAQLLKCFVNDRKISITEADFLALPQIEKELSRTNSKGKTTTGVYKGVHWTEIAKFIGADPNTSVTLVASDGYESTITADALNDPDSLFAFYQDGENIESEGDGRVWFCASENFTANFWAKYVVKIVVE